MAPLTIQEERVKDVLTECRLRHKVHEAFVMDKRYVVVDFFLNEHNVVIECWISRSRRGAAMGWMERNAAFIDLKFRRLKELIPGLRCYALAEAPRVELPELVEVVEAVMPHADYVAYSMDDFVSAIVQLGGAS
jgi:hypothetical protein